MDVCAVTKKLTDDVLLNHADINECLTKPSPCSSNATCMNTDGSFVCQCMEGYTGNGTICEGITSGNLGSLIAVIKKYKSRRQLRN